MWIANYVDDGKVGSSALEQSNRNYLLVFYSETNLKSFMAKLEQKTISGMEHRINPRIVNTWSTEEDTIITDD